jgi:putative Mg2+ transporter-C (MgtC) family protein
MPSEADLLLRVLLAALLGGAVGFDREVRRKPAGMRTHMLVATGSALFYAAGILILDETVGTQLDGDVLRVPAAIVTGVGFLGAGAIMRAGDRVTGLTTAAGIWVVAAIGLLAGAGFFVLAIGATALVLLIVNILAWIYYRVQKAETHTDLE